MAAVNDLLIWILQLLMSKVGFLYDLTTHAIVKCFSYI